MDLAELSDRERIRSVVYAYCHHVDRGEAAEVAALFTDDAVFVTSTGRNGTATGRNEIAARITRLLSTFESTSHHVSNISIRFTGYDIAEVETYLYAWHRFPGERPDGYLWGRYVDTFARPAGSWLIQSRTLQVVGEQDFPFGWVPYRS